MMRRVAFVVGVSATAYASLIDVEASVKSDTKEDAPASQQLQQDTASEKGDKYRKGEDDEDGKACDEDCDDDDDEEDEEDEDEKEVKSDTKENAPATPQLQQDTANEKADTYRKGEDDEDGKACDEGCDDEDDDEEGCDGCDGDSAGDRNQKEDDDEDDEDEDEEEDDNENTSEHAALFQKLSFAHGSADQDAIFREAKTKNMPAMVVITKFTCPHCTELGESMLEDSAMKTVMKKFLPFHVTDAEGADWGQDTYVPRAYFFAPDGAQIDIHSPNKKYPYFFSKSKQLLNAMKKVLQEV